MNTFKKKFILHLLCAMFVMFTVSEQGFGQARVLKTDNPIPNKYIVVLNKDTFNDVSKLPVRPTAQNLVGKHRGRLGFVYEKAIKGFSVELSKEAAIALSQNPLVEYVTEDSEVYLSDTQYDAPWNLDRIDQRDLSLNTTYIYNNNGSGATVYIIDSGINRFHSEFGGLSTRAFIGADFVGGNGADCTGHGTHVAGIAGGSTYGVAKGVTIVAVRVFGCSTTSPSSTIIAGIDWVRDNHASKAVANMSFGGSANQAMDDAVIDLINSGVTAVVAAGNDNADANNTSPARVREAITVGATDINDSRASFSNYGSAVDIFAPGVDINSAWWDGGLSVQSGTSMAAPHVTGAVAQYIISQGLTIPTPSTVQDVIVANASWNKLSNIGSNSPNTLLYNASFYYGDTIRPLYRYWSATANDHYYINTWSDLGAGRLGYAVYKIEGYVYPTQVSGTVPLHQYWNSSTTSHFYTTNFSELGNGAYGYGYYGVSGYVYSTQQTGTVALHRYWNSSINSHFYTTDFSELGNGANGYVYIKIEGYIFQP